VCCKGIFKHSQELSKAYLADIMPRSQRSHVFGRFNSISNIGFIVGPVIGGYVVDQLGGFHVVAVVTAGIFMLNFGQLISFCSLFYVSAQCVQILHMFCICAYAQLVSSLMSNFFSTD